MQTLCILLPALNEQSHLPTLINQIKSLQFDDVEIIPLVINDGSTDQTAKVAKDAGATVLSHETNRGVGAAFRTGVQWARDQKMDFLLHMDSDGQVPPQEIRKLFPPVLNNEVDLAIGSRFMSKRPENLSLWKAFMLKVFATFFGVLVGRKVTDLSCGFRCMNKKTYEALNPTFDYDYIQETLIQAFATGARAHDVSVEILYGEDAFPKGMSSSTLKYGIRYILLIGYSVLWFYTNKLKGWFS